MVASSHKQALFNHLWDFSIHHISSLLVERVRVRYGQAARTGERTEM